MLGTLPSESEGFPHLLFVMNTDIRSPALYPATREEALDRLEEFLPHCGRYAERRNHLEPGHENVSRLSPALRLRTLLEREVCERVEGAYPASQVEKFLQEVYWRLYWKGWLEMRPEVWTNFRERRSVFPRSILDRAALLEQGESGVAIMDSFARELVETGYLHNHARMWFASFWIHGARLPWELGADFFLRHLLDGDAASNTLSWRWVAGLHTPGKSYLVRRSNLERYCPPELLETHSAGLEELERIEPWQPDGGSFLNPDRRNLTNAELDPQALEGRWGLWIHEDDLSPERSELAAHQPACIYVASPREGENSLADPEQKLARREPAFVDARERARNHFTVEAEHGPTAGLAEWAAREHLDTVVALQPFVGPVADQLPDIRHGLEEAGSRLYLFRRQSDASVMRFATAGFFGFWKKCLKAGEVAAN